MDARSLRKSVFGDDVFELQFFGEGLFGLKKQEGGKEWSWRGKYNADAASNTLTLVPSHVATPEVPKSKKLKNKGEEKWVLKGNDDFTAWTGDLVGKPTTLKVKAAPAGDDDDLGF
eukprot:TRINITY_DN14668_c0_g1_i1.p2 TRINITY_DN14668_c0_g1~~TRINITY_DN14668_c0_g1_i1.p2  ORF type:complete len:116 (-),score=30.73 TRINITY_DN14668_c0_g1_i1:50-397(-)